MHVRKYSLKGTGGDCVRILAFVLRAKRYMEKKEGLRYTSSPKRLEKNKKMTKEASTN